MKKSKPTTVDEYILSQPDFIRKLLEQIRKTIKEVAPQVEESIRYNMPAFKINQTHIYIASYKNHIGMYPMYGMDDIEEEISAYRAKEQKTVFIFRIPYQFLLISLKKL